MTHGVREGPARILREQLHLPVIEVPDISRLSVFTVTRKRSRRAGRSGARRSTAPRRSARWSTGTAPAGCACRAPTPPAGPSAHASPSAVDVDVVDDPHAVPEPVGAAHLHGLPDARQAERLAGVDRHVEVLARAGSRTRPGGATAGSRPPRRRCRTRRRRGRGAAPPARRSHGLRAACRIAVSRVRTRIGLPAAAAPPSPARSPRCTAVDHLVQGQAALEVLFGGVPHLGVDDAVGGEVHRALARDPRQARPATASRRPCGRTSPGSAPGEPESRRREPAPSSSASVGGQPRGRSPPASSTMVAGPQAAVEVVVQQGLRRPAHDRLRQRRAAARLGGRAGRPTRRIGPVSTLIAPTSCRRLRGPRRPRSTAPPGWPMQDVWSPLPPSMTEPAAITPR